MSLRLVTAPATEPISLAEAKGHLRVDHTDDDATITFLITASRQYVDAISGWLGRALITQTWELVIDAFPTGQAQCCWPAAPVMATSSIAIEIPFPPLQSVTSIKYFDVAGIEQTMPATDYVVDTVSAPGWIVPVTSWPATLAAINAVTIRFIAGYGPAATDVPAPIRQALLLMTGLYYENREQVIAQYEGSATVLPLPLGVESLLSAFRIIRV